MVYSSFGELGTILEKQDQSTKSVKPKRTRLYPPTNPYALVAVALDIRPIISSMVSIHDVTVHTHIFLRLIFRIRMQVGCVPLNSLVMFFKMI